MQSQITLQGNLEMNQITQKCIDTGKDPEDTNIIIKLKAIIDQISQHRKITNRAAQSRLVELLLVLK